MLNNNEVNNKEEKDDLVEEQLEEVTQEIDNKTEDEDTNDTEITANCTKEVSFFKSFSAVLIDEGIVGAISVGLLYLIDILMRQITGYYITQMVTMYLIIFAVVMLLYVSIMESAKNGQTFGKKIMKLKTTKIQ